MATQKLSDIPSIRELLAQADGATALTAMLRYVPFLGRVMGLTNQKVRELHSTAAETRTKARQMVSVLDRFHAHFAKEGWIFYESMDVPAAVRAVELADRGDFQGALDALVDHYSEERIGFHLIRLAGLDCGRERRRLLSLAREDYAAGRYHACVPVVLAQMDGMVNDLQQLGFFAEGSDLTAHDSLAGHSEGLTKVAGFFRKGRNKTRNEDLAIPYRNGIMHGTDLGYDNQVVAAKCWAALFATVDWAGLVERGHRDGKPKPPGWVRTFPLPEILRSTGRTRPSASSWSSFRAGRRGTTAAWRRSWPRPGAIVGHFPRRCATFETEEGQPLVRGRGGRWFVIGAP